jgi:hypothetical protein
MGVIIGRYWPKIGHAADARHVKDIRSDRSLARADELVCAVAVSCIRRWSLAARLDLLARDRCQRGPVASAAIEAEQASIRRRTRHLSGRINRVEGGLFAAAYCAYLAWLLVVRA